MGGEKPYDKGKVESLSRKTEAILSQASPYAIKICFYELICPETENERVELEISRFSS